MKRFVLFTVAAMTGMMLALAHNPFANAQEVQYQDADAITRGLMAVTGDYGRVDLDVRFRTNSSALTDSARRQLDALAHAINSPKLGNARFLIAGHTDARGAASYNRQLSRRRADAVMFYLINRHAVNAGRLQSVGYGEDRPRNAYNPSAAENRRVEVINLTPYGDGAPAAAPTPPAQHAPQAPSQAPATPGGKFMGGVESIGQ